MVNQQKFNIHKSFWLVWWFFLFIKLAIAYALPLFADEAYYWVWSKHLSLSYFDHPPMVSWLMWLGHPFENWGGLVRAPAVVFGHFGFLIWYQILRDGFSPGEMVAWLTLCCLNPLIGWGGSIVTPDLPLLVFWSLSLFYLFRALKSEQLSDYLLLGISAGLGFCSKYNMVLLLPFSMVWLYAANRLKQIKVVGLLLALITTVLVAMPVLIWNQQNEWASFQFQIHRGLQQSFNLNWSLEYLASQIGLLFPVIIYFSIRYFKSNKTHWLNWFGWLPVILFFVSSFRGRVEPNWTAIGYAPLLAAAIKSANHSKWLRITKAIWIFGFITALSLAFYNWLPINSKEIKTNEHLNFKEHIEVAQEYSPLYFGSYQMASYVYWYTKSPAYKLKNIHRKDHFDFMPESEPNLNEFYAIIDYWSHKDYWINKGYEIEPIKYVLETDQLVRMRKK